MDKISPFLRRCLLLLPLALMVASDSIAQGFEPRIVFASNRDGDWDIYSMDVNGENLLQLADHPAPDDHPAGSPDGRRITFRSRRGLTPDLYVMDSDGTNVIRLTRDNFGEGRPSWTPDGTRIAFSSFRFDVGNSELYAMTADGKYLKQLSDVHDARDYQPDISPLGLAVSPASNRITVWGKIKSLFD